MTNKLQLELALSAMQSINAHYLIKPIPIYFAKCKNYEELAEICESILKKWDSTNFSDQERAMMSWLLSNHELQLGLITSHDCLGLRSSMYSFRYIEVTLPVYKPGVGPWLFHGSMDFNWYGIIKHGLLDMSRTELSQNGLAFGKGLYCSSDWRVALMYCKNSKPRIIAAMRCTQDPAEWERGRDTYVIPDPKYLSIKYLIMIDDAIPRAKL